MGLFGSIGRALGGAVSGFIRGGPVGAVTGAVGAVVGRPAGSVTLPAPPPLPSPFGPMPWPGTGSNPGVQLFGPGSGNLPALPPDNNPNRFPVGGGGGVMSPLGTMAKLPSGYHVNRTLQRAAVMQQNRGGLTPGMQRAVSQVQRAIVKNQHMNALNPRALRRAERRARSFIRFSRKMVKYFTPKAPKGKAYIKTRRR